MDLRAWIPAVATLCGVPFALAGTVLLEQVVAPPRWVLIGAGATLLTGAASVLRPLAARARPDPTLLAAVGGMLAPAVATAWATGRLLGASHASRLAWMLGEEDNAHVVGVARELLASGPGGAELAAVYGTSFATPGVALLRSGLVGGATGDERLDAITATTAASAALPLLLGLVLVLGAVAIRASSELGRGIPPARGIMSSPLAALVGAGGLGLATQLVAVALPMQLGFATLAWAIVWTLVGWSALLGTYGPGLPYRTQAALMIQVAMAGVLLEGSWPFLTGALLLPVMVRFAEPTLSALRRVENEARARVVRRTALGVLATLALVAVVLAGSGAFRTVLSFGRIAFTAGVEVGASTIMVGPALFAAALLAVILTGHGLRSERRITLRVLSAVAGTGASLGLVWSLALVAADGITGYGGRKLALALVMLAVAAATASTANRWTLLTAVASWSVVALLLIDPLGRTAADWWARTAPREPPHAVATIVALESSSPDVPVRCRPATGTANTPAARLAAYFCIVWMEDAFNGGPGSGNRFGFFQADGPTLDDAVRAAEEEGLYGFAITIRLGPGWYGWDGRS